MCDIIKERTLELINMKYDLLEQIISKIKSNLNNQHRNKDEILSLLNEFISKNKQVQKEIDIIMYAYNLALVDIGNIIINKVARYNIRNKEKYIDKLLELLESAIKITAPQIIMKIFGL